MGAWIDDDGADERGKRAKQRKGEGRGTLVRYNITLCAPIYRGLHSRPSFICKTIVGALLWRIVGSGASSVQSTTPRLFPAIFSLIPSFHDHLTSLFRLLFHPSSRFLPYLIPFSLFVRLHSPLFTDYSFIFSTSVFGSELRLFLSTACR